MCRKSFFGLFFVARGRLVVPVLKCEASYSGSSTNPH